MAARRRPKPKVTPLRSGSFVNPDAKFKLRQERHTLGRGLEIIGVISACLFLSIGAVMGLFHLAKYQKVQLDRLKEVNREVTAMETQIEIERQKLAQSFSTGSSQESVLHRQGFLQPDEVSIKLVERDDQSFPPSVTASKEEREE